MPRVRKPLPPIPEKALLELCWRGCTRPRCRKCVGGAKGHGPYWYAAWDIVTDGVSKRHRAYIGKTLPRELAEQRLRAEGRLGSKYDVEVRRELRMRRSEDEERDVA